MTNQHIATRDKNSNLPAVEMPTLDNVPSIFNPEKFGHMLRIAEVMASGKATVPTHLQGKAADCLAIIQQAERWGMDPFAVAQKTHIVSGNLGYEGQLVAAVVNSRAPIEGRLSYEWGADGSKNTWENLYGKFKSIKTDKGGSKFIKAWQDEEELGLFCKISATLIGDEEPTSFKLYLAQAQVRNSPLWAQDPRQQLAYLASKRFARIYFPDLILGVYTADEIEAQPLPPQETGLAKKTSKKKSRLDRMVEKENANAKANAQDADFDEETGEVTEDPESSEPAHSFPIIELEEGQIGAFAAEFIKAMNDIGNIDELAAYWKAHHDPLAAVKSENEGMYKNCERAKDKRKDALQNPLLA